MKKNLKKPVILVVICCFVLYLFINYVLPPNLHGKWYLYTGSDINTEKNISEKLNSKDYIEITTRLVKTYRSDGKDGVSAYKIKGNKMYNGDAIFKFKVTNIGEEKILYLTVIGYNFGHGEDEYIENGETYTYVFERDN